MELMAQFALQLIAAISKIGEQLAHLWVVNGAFLFIRQKILLADIGDITIVSILCQQMVKGLVFGGPDFFGDRLIPFFAVRKDGVDIENDAPEWEDFMADNRANAKARMRNGRGLHVMMLLIGMCHKIKFSASGKNRKAALALDSPLG
jgi:hypothetical protein